MQWLAWGFVGFGPTLIAAYMAARAVRHPSPESGDDSVGIYRITSWIMPALAVLAVQPLVHRTDSDFGLVLLCVLPLYVFYITGTGLQVILPNGWDMSRKTVVKLLFWNVNPAIAITLLLLGSALIKGEEFRLVPSVILYVLIKAAIYGLRLVLSPTYPFTRKLKRLAPCELSNRVLGMAREQGVDIKHVHIITTDWRYIGACARSESSIALSETLVQQLNKPEVDAVVAHEIGHTADRAMWRYEWFVRTGLMALLLLGMLATERGIGALPQQFGYLHYLVWLILFALPPIAGTLHTHYHEQRANEAARQYGDPVSVVSGKYKLHKLNGLPLARPGWARIVSTHPTFEDETAVVAKKAGLYADDLKQICRRADSEMESDSGERYEIIYHEQTPQEMVVKTRRIERKITTGCYSPLLGMACVGFMVLTLVLAMPLEKYHPDIPFLVSLFSTVSMIILLWRLFERKAAAEEREQIADITAKISTRHPGELNESALLATAVLMGDWDEWLWQPAYLSVRDGQLRLLCESVEERISVEDVSDVITEARSHSLNDTSRYTLVSYQVGGTRQWLALRTFIYPPKKQPRSEKELTRLLRERLTAEGASLVDHGLSWRIVAARAKRAAVAVLITSALVLPLYYLMGLISLPREARELIVMIVGTITANQFWKWVKQAGTQ